MATSHMRATISLAYASAFAPRRISLAAPQQRSLFRDGYRRRRAARARSRVVIYSPRTTCHEGTRTAGKNTLISLAAPPAPPHYFLRRAIFASIAVADAPRFSSHCLSYFISAYHARVMAGRFSQRNTQVLSLTAECYLSDISLLYAIASTTPLTYRQHNFPHRAPMGFGLQPSPHTPFQGKTAATMPCHAQSRAHARQPSIFDWALASLCFSRKAFSLTLRSCQSRA